eukprot:gene5477-6028_t
MSSDTGRPRSNSNTPGVLQPIVIGSGRSTSHHHHKHHNNKSVVTRPTTKQLFGAGTGNAEKRQIVGQYMLGKTIGEGTFGKVKLAVHIPTGEKVAVKILEKNRIKEAADVRRVNREIKILKKARHGNVIQLYEVLDTQHTIYLIMECCEGGELFDFIVAQKHVAEPQACKFFHQLVDGVDVLHKNEITHRDLKPENLLLKSSPDGWIVKIVDFGLSNTHEGGKFLSTACGSPCYAAPEMIAGKKYFGPLADIWSMGVILFALVCGFLPFEDANTSVLYRKILSGEYRAARWISNDVRDLIRKILEVDPNKRYTLEDIRRHPWYCQIRDDEIPREYINPYEDDTTRNETLAVLAASGIDTQAVLDGLASKACNSLTAMYFLFEQKHRTQRGKLLQQGNNQLQKSREMLANKSDSAAFRLPNAGPVPLTGITTGGGVGVGSTSTRPSINTNDAALLIPLNPGIQQAVKPSPLFAPGIASTAPSSGNGVGNLAAIPPPSDKSPKGAANGFFGPAVAVGGNIKPSGGGSVTPYLQAPSILSQSSPKATAAVTMNNFNFAPVSPMGGNGGGGYVVSSNAPSVEVHSKPNPPTMSNPENSHELHTLLRPEVPKLAVKSIPSTTVNGNNGNAAASYGQTNNKDVLVSQTARPHGSFSAAAPAAMAPVVPQTARPAAGGEVPERPITRRSLRASQQGATMASAATATAAAVMNVPSGPGAASITISNAAPIVPTAPAAPSGSVAPGGGGRRGRNLVQPANSSISSTAADASGPPSIRGSVDPSHAQDNRASAVAAAITQTIAVLEVTSLAPRVVAGDISAEAYHDSRNDAQRNKQANQGTANLLH